MKRHIKIVILVLISVASINASVHHTRGVAEASDEVEKSFGLSAAGERSLEGGDRAEEDGIQVLVDSIVPAASDGDIDSKKGGLMGGTRFIEDLLIDDFLNQPGPAPECKDDTSYQYVYKNKKGITKKVKRNGCKFVAKKRKKRCRKMAFGRDERIRDRCPVTCRWCHPHHFHKWMDEHSKSYASTEEMKTKFEIWKDNHAFIEEHNNQDPPPSYTMDHNQFSDMTEDEFNRMYRLGRYSPEPGMNQPNAASNFRRELVEEERGLLDIPDEIDWVERGALGPVKDQGQCQSCWAFTSVATIEAAHFLDFDGEMLDLSEQELIDCNTKHMSCEVGGSINLAYFYDEHSQGLCSEEDYPYTGKDDTCKRIRTKNFCKPVHDTTTTSFVNVDATTDALMQAVAIKPVAVDVYAGGSKFQFYSRGVFDDPNCSNKVDHAVVVVGYGTQGKKNKEYFNVRNSWGSSWGNNGYMKISRKNPNNDGFGMCGILSRASYPVLQK